MTVVDRCAGTFSKQVPSRFGQRATTRLQALGERARAAATGDGGNTLIELMVGMVLMTVAGAIFTTAVVTLSKTTNQAQAIGDATQQNNQAFQTLDRTARYASVISKPGQTPDDSWWIEFRGTSNGADTCTQLHTDKGLKQLLFRQWPADAAVVSVKPRWTPVTSGLTNAASTDATTQPFRLLALSPTAARQQLQITLVTSAGPASAPSSSKSQFTVSAANSNAATPSSFCQQVPRS